MIRDICFSANTENTSSRNTSFSSETGALAGMTPIAHGVIRVDETYKCIHIYGTSEILQVHMPGTSA